MALIQKVYGVRTSILPRIFRVHGIFNHHYQSRKPVAVQSEIGNLAGLELQGQFVCDKGDKFGIRGFSLCIADCVPKEPLKGIQITSVPSYFDGMADGSFHSTGCGLEGLGHLGVQYLGDGIDDIHIVHRNDDGLSQILVALDVSGDADDVHYAVYGVNALVFIPAWMFSRFIHFLLVFF